MGQGEEVKTRTDPRVEIKERGEIFFFYRPKVNKEEAHSADDVQRLYVVLRPESGERSVEEKQAPDSGKEGEKMSEEAKDIEEEEDADDEEKDRRGSEGGHGSEEVNIEEQPLFRFIVMGRKSLPDPSQRSRPYWGFVEMVTTRADDIKTALKGAIFFKQRNTTPQPVATAANPQHGALAEGIYRILRHQSANKTAHTHLIYKLELPPPTNRRHEPQESLNTNPKPPSSSKSRTPSRARLRRTSSRPEGEAQGVVPRRRPAEPDGRAAVLGGGPRPIS
ncbi:uncharacterized protein A4U43_C01F35470 [Asparagus officinalis]|uniref:Uncharacterized protein n=1 Tax=Asparagus officinalis TaxID=4686 RepID=A0A5P1FUN7_ASPOF|nr:uncharacterized protein A4U43_C01F35470 [Asparagus officinalis]